MTWIVDQFGRRWVEPVPRKRRAPGRALRFAELKVGDQIMAPTRWATQNSVIYYIVTDLWFDPVCGQLDETSGLMVAIRRLGQDGEPCARKERHTLRGLAQNGYHYSDIDYASMAKARLQAHRDGKLIGIGVGKMIRARPKLPGKPL
jgi:hypothetical protein